MNKTYIATALAALTFATSGDVLAAGKKEMVPCVSDSRMERIIQEIPKHFKHPKINPSNYKKQDTEHYWVIEKNPKGGALTILANTSGLNNGLHFNDRRDSNPMNWYHISNLKPMVGWENDKNLSPWESRPLGCVGNYNGEFGTYYNTKFREWSGKPISRDEAQRKFNDIIYTIERKIK